MSSVRRRQRATVRLPELHETEMRNIETTALPRREALCVASSRLELAQDSSRILHLVCDGTDKPATCHKWFLQAGRNQWLSAYSFRVFPSARENRFWLQGRCPHLSNVLRDVSSGLCPYGIHDLRRRPITLEDRLSALEHDPLPFGPFRDGCG